MINILICSIRELAMAQYTTPQIIQEPELASKHTFSWFYLFSSQMY